MAAATIQHAGQRRVIGVMPGAGSEWSTLSPAGHAAIDQARVGLQADLRAKAQALHHAGAEPFEQHIGFGDHAQYERAYLRILEVNADGFLATVGHCLASTAKQL